MAASTTTYTANGSTLDVGVEACPAELILHDEFLLYPRSRLLRVTLTTNSVIYTHVYGPRENMSTASTTVLLLRDVVGCDCLKGRDSIDFRAYITFYAYPRKKKPLSKRFIRKRQPLIFTVFSQRTYQENLRIAERWRLAVACLLRGNTVTGFQDLSRLSYPPPRRLLVLVNPFSGPGKALQLFQERVIPIFAESGLHFTMVVTERAGHARDIVKSMRLEDWYGIIIVSGDGLIYEVVNGLMARLDWETAIQTPIGALPGGSGNALCCSLNFLAGESFKDNFALHSSFVIAKHEVCRMDLVAVDTIKQRIYSFLSLSWGMLADIDIESERFRSIGNARFTVGALSKCIGLKKYRGRLSFLPVEYTPKRIRPRSLSVQDCTRLNENNIPSNMHHSTTMPAGFGTTGTLANGRSMVNLPTSPSSQSLSNPDAELTLDTSIEQDDSDESGPPSATISSYQNGSAIRPGGTDGSESGDEERSHVPTPLMPPLEEPVPDDWVVIEGEFLLVNAVIQTHISPDGYMAPSASLDDGMIHLQFIRGDTVRSETLKFLLSIEDGGHESLPHVELAKVKAFRIEPFTETGIMTVDGEMVDYGPIQAQILPSVARVMAVPGDEDIFQ